MKKYFLHNGSESSGPFTLEELKAKRISKTTPIWFEGMEHWKTAGEIPELTSVFVVSPPPFKTAATPLPNVKKIPEDRKILGMSKNSFFIIASILVLGIVTVVFNTLQENRNRELEIKNHKTEVENYQYELQQKEIEQQKIILAEQQKKEEERLMQEKKETANKRLLEIKNLLLISQDNIKNTEEKLNDASSFKLLRTALEKKEQIDLLHRNIDSIKNEMENLKKESNQLKLELEKIH